MTTTLADRRTALEKQHLIDPEVCRKHGMDWAALKPIMRAGGRYHVETS